MATFDPVLDLYYAHIGDHWYYNLGGSLENVTVLSIGGGGRDVLVRSDLTKFENRLRSAIYDQKRNDSGGALFETVAPDVPWVWATTDHLCIVWCKQLVMTTVRALFDMAIQSAAQGDGHGAMAFSRNPKVHRDVIRYHFFERDDWKKDKKARKAHQLMLDDEERMQHDFLAKLASVSEDF